MNHNKWINTIPHQNNKISQERHSLDPNIWINTIPKKNKKNSVTKYTSIIILFVIGLISVSMIKNTTRNLQKEIDNLKTSIDDIKFNLHNELIEHEFITSPENISLLAKEYLESDLTFYKKSQIRDFNKRNYTLIKPDEKNNKSSFNNKSKKLPESIKLIVKKKVDQKKIELQKVKELYKQPENLPREIKSQVVKKFEKKRTLLKKLYSEPKETINLKKIQQWGTIQMVKAFLGIPIIPGK